MPGETVPGDTGNSILDALPASVRRSLYKYLVRASAGTRLVSQGARISHVFFPTTSVCSLVVEFASGDKAETGTVGSDGFVGVPLVLGMPLSYSNGVVHVPGEGYRMSAKQILELCRQHQDFRNALFRYGGFCLHVASRSVACNSFHSIVQRAARWLLLAHDRAGQDEFQLTHELLSAMLAATRPRVSQAAAKLKAAGIIDYRRGKVRILNRGRLEAVSCECYEETRRALPAYSQ
jgi:CRP-like cAMP-binding protein